DVNKEIQYSGKVNYIIHAASNTHPLAYATDPIGTISTNVIGTNNLLKFASQKNIDKFIFLSSVEIYGQNNGDVETFAEDYSGYIDCN
ncbi:NAD-dependent epimerase/dehydratase family protein, partial [Limosilactobacillus reuteri]